MMYHVKKIDEFNSSNIDKIVSLLNCSFLGEFHFTKEWFIWKHVNSYFGASLAWGVFCENELVGIRLYSKWHNFSSNEQFVQAVDTATHPNHQRKGLFSLLIKESLIFLTSNDIKIFNFPNRNSYSQYLKYGWKDSNKINWNICLLPKVYFFDCASEIQTKNCSIANEFINWRFVNNPIYSYLIFQGKKSIVVFKKVDEIIPYYQIVFTDYDAIDKVALCRFMYRNKIFVTRYINTDINSYNFSKHCFLLVLNTTKSFNFVTRDIDYELSNISLSDTDFI